MIKSIEQLKIIDKQIEQLKKVIKTRAWISGFTVTYGFGGNDPEQESDKDPYELRRMQFGFTSGIEEEFPQILLRGLENTRKTWLDWAKRDKKEIDDYLISKQEIIENENKNSKN